MILMTMDKVSLDKNNHNNKRKLKLQEIDYHHDKILQEIVGAGQENHKQNFSIKFSK
jgi:hypothetical protein